MGGAAIDALGFAAGALTTGAAVPQIVHAWRTRSMRDVSVSMLLSMAAGIALWLLYGLALRSAPLVVWNAVTLSFYAVLLALKFRLAARPPLRGFPAKARESEAGGFPGAANVIEDVER